ncbi:MAG TPA: lipopolysaccharide kinase InaA family protein [Nevskiaceae bacterium]
MSFKEIGAAFDNENHYRLHAHGFCHGDLNWRNLLVSAGDPPVVYFIDAERGQRWHGLLLQYRRARDLAYLLRDARSVLSSTQMLRFYLCYRRRAWLAPAGKVQIHRIMAITERF